MKCVKFPIVEGFQSFCTELPEMEEACDDTETERFFYNPEMQNCEAFTDRGCNNDVRNNFNSYQTCKSTCGGYSLTCLYCIGIAINYHLSTKCFGKNNVTVYNNDILQKNCKCL